MYLRGRHQAKALDSLTLIVDDFADQPALGYQIDVSCASLLLYFTNLINLQRLRELLRPHGTATVVSMMYGDDRILELLNMEGFAYSRTGWIQNLVGDFEKFEYWTRDYNTSESLVFGFRSRGVDVREYDTLPLDAGPAPWLM